MGTLVSRNSHTACTHNAVYWLKLDAVCMCGYLEIQIEIFQA